MMKDKMSFLMMSTFDPNLPPAVEPKRSPVQGHPSKRRAARILAMQFLYMIERNKNLIYSDLELARFIQGMHNSVHCDLPFLKHLCKNVFRNKKEIDKTLIESSPKWRLARMASVDRCVLEIGVFELKYTSTPSKVIIDEAVSVAKIYGSKESGAFVNGVLDKVLQDTLQSSKESLELADKKEDPIRN